MISGSSTESYPEFAHIGLRENPGKNLNQPSVVKTGQPRHKIMGGQLVLSNCEQTQSVNVLYLSTGLTIGWPSPTLPVLREDESILGGRTITVDEESWLGSLPYLGGLVATPFHSYINQNFGRKSTGYFTALSFALGWLCISFGNGIAIFCIGRFILGMGLSGTAVIGTLYIGETSQDDMRGRLGVIRGVLKHTGIILVYVIGTYLSVMNTALVCASFILVFLLSFFFMPESPMFLLEKGKTKETLDSYVWLRGGDTQFAEQEVTKLSAVVDSEKAGKKPSLREILSVKGTRKALIITAVLSITQQFGGLNVVYSYCASIIELTGGDVPPHIASFIASFAGLAGSVLTCFTSDRLGRKFFLISTNALMAILLVLLGVYSYLKSLGIDVSSAGLLPVICISLYCGLAIAGPFNIYYVVLSEIFRPEARGLGMIVANNDDSAEGAQIRWSDMGHWLRRNCLLKNALEGMVNGRRVRSRRRHQMIDDIKIYGSYAETRRRRKLGKIGERWVCSERPALG
ncbi:hypothetical protein ANN_04614 [Periplaneta americana]|uniref:Major facilitator superfamily (MFS) profile domain-containing protein n=1 Tax=Periplaneta americana TaxID=6978 RepID=A0ABQ8TAX8_PERAM|nr:hypothetical protein ANN_04614 [Periplaneta americana]